MIHPFPTENAQQALALLFGRSRAQLRLLLGGDAHRVEDLIDGLYGLCHLLREEVERRDGTRDTSSYLTPAIMAPRSFFSEDTRCSLAPPTRKSTNPCNTRD